MYYWIQEIVMEEGACISGNLYKLEIIIFTK